MPFLDDPKVRELIYRELCGLCGKPLRLKRLSEKNRSLVWPYYCHIRCCEMASMELKP